MPPIPLIDVFAGPGGLGEGFSALRQRKQRVFRPGLSIEKDPAAHRTLKLRAFFRQFPDGQAPPAYYDHLRGDLSLTDLYAKHPVEHEAAAHEAWCHELSASTNDRVRQRIRANLADPSQPWVLLGGPPCQPFSLAGRSRNRKNTQYADGKETRHTLYREYLQIIADFWPAVFVMENVRGLLSARYDGAPIFPQIKQDLENPAAVVGNKRRRGKPHPYTLYPITPCDHLFPDDPVSPNDFLVRCEDFGIPQARHRLILLGVRDDIDATPHSLKARKPVPARQVLDGLPPLRGGLSKNDSPQARHDFLQQAHDAPWLDQLFDQDEATGQHIEQTLHRLARSAKQRIDDRGADFIPGTHPPAYRRDWFHDPALQGVCNHTTRGHMPSDLHRYLFCACFSDAHGRSPKLTDFPPALLPNHKNAKKPNARTKFADRFRVQLANQPSTTVVSHISKDGHYYIHPDPAQCRSLTVREAARLQTFPDNYRFVGNRTEQYHQVGNAVPPLLAYQIAGIVYDLLKRSGLA